MIQTFFRGEGWTDGWKEWTAVIQVDSSYTGDHTAGHHYTHSHINLRNHNKSSALERSVKYNGGGLEPEVLGLISSSADSERASVSLLRKYVHLVLVNLLGGLSTG